MVKILKYSALLLVLVILFSSLVLAETPANIENDCIYYFYGQGCDNCEVLGNFLTQLQDKYPSLTIKKIEVYYNKPNYQLLQQYFISYNVPKKSQGLPAAFISNGYFIGDQEIKALLEERIKNNKDNACPALGSQVSTIGVLGEEKSASTILSGLTMPVLTSSALTNSLAPGALALTALLLIILVTFKVRREMFKRGMLFILGIFLAYFLFSLGIFSWFAISAIKIYFYKIVAILGIIFSVWMIKKYWEARQQDYRPAGRSYHPNRKTFDQVLVEIFAPQIVVILGFLLGLCSFARINEDLLFIRYIFLEGSANWTALGLLLYYLFIFLLPSLILVLLFSYSRGALEEHANKRGLPAFHLVEWWKRHNLELLNLIISLIVLLIGMYLVVV